jgi:hypothetical protein
MNMHTKEIFSKNTELEDLSDFVVVKTGLYFFKSKELNYIFDFESGITSRSQHSLFASIHHPNPKMTICTKKAID